MRIFLSHASEQAGIAETVALALRGEGHTVFFDRTSLPSGDSYDARIRDAIADSDLFIFLISPEAVAHGRYTLTEAELAEARWSSPVNHVLPVVVRPTPLDTVPAYLKAVTILEPQGNIAAEISAAVRRLSHPRWRRRARILVPVGLVAVLAGGGLVARSVIAQRRLTREVQNLLDAGRLQQSSRNYAAAADWYERAAAASPGAADVTLAQERLAMDWLEHARVTAGVSTFTALVDKVDPPLVRCATGADAMRAADCLAHLGWGDFLRARDGATNIDPVLRYRGALDRDPRNVYAHAMWGFEIYRTRGPVAEGKDHFANALAAGREREYVRSLQLAGLFWRQDTDAEDEAIRVANDMRVKGEAFPAEADNVTKGRLWSLYDSRVFRRSELPSFLALLSPADHLATFHWLFDDPGSSRTGTPELRLFVLATLQENAGQRTEALASFEKLRDGLAKSGGLKYGGPLPDQTIAAVKRLSQR